MATFKSSLNSMNWGLKLILTIIYDIYGILCRLSSGKVLPIIIALCQIFSVNFFGIFWLIDLITVICKKKVTFLA